MKCHWKCSSGLIECRSDNPAENYWLKLRFFLAKNGNSCSSKSNVFWIRFQETSVSSLFCIFFLKMGPSTRRIKLWQLSRSIFAQNPETFSSTSEHYSVKILKRKLFSNLFFSKLIIWPGKRQFWQPFWIFFHQGCEKFSVKIRIFFDQSLNMYRSKFKKYSVFSLKLCFRNLGSGCVILKIVCPKLLKFWL